MKATFVLILLLAAKAVPATIESPAPPSFRFFRENQASPKDRRVLAQLRQWTVQPNATQQQEILRSMLEGELRPYFFLSAAKHMAGAMQRDLRQAYNAKLKAAKGEDEAKAYALDENTTSSDFPSNESEEDSATSQYAFRCLDFDGDHRIDLLVFNQVYFGPSAGLVFYGWDGKRYRHLFDCSGTIAKIERLGDKLYLRFVVTIIDRAETEILATVSYDFKTKTCVLDSKLNYAQQTRFPKSIDAPRPFSLAAATALRVTPVTDDTPNKPDANGNFDWQTTRTLRGNVVADMPASAGGFILAKQGAWACVAFSTKVMPTDHSLRHGMEPEVADPKADTRHTVYPPCQYFCGWIENKALAPAP